MDLNNQQVPEGTLIGDRYSIVRAIGQGGMAHVYLATDQQTGGPVAIKIMKDDLSRDREFIKKFDTEARAASSLDHPNIVRVLGYGQDGDLRYIVQEYVEGSTLKDLIKQRGMLDWKVSVPLAIQIGLALEHAHRRGVIHRDIKPHNILITRDMVAKVTDFGIARAINSNTITLTSGVTFGSVHYFSPEQARGSLVSEKSDIYSLGIMLYEMVTGQVPFDGETSVAIAIKHLQETPQPPSAVRPGIPVGLDRIILKCIRKSPDNRYQDARELVDELDAFMIEPEGVYGAADNVRDGEGNTTALGLKRPEPNYGKLREIEKMINERRHSRQRDVAIVISIVLLSLVFLTSIGIWVVQKIQTSMTGTTEAEFEVKDYVGQEWTAIEQILKKAGVNYAPVFRANDSVNEGIIIDQNPKAGYLIKPGGSTLTLYISGGKNLVTILNYAGQTYKKAETELEQTYGFKVTLTYEYSDFDQGVVIKTIPEAGQSVPNGSDITLVVSDGQPKVLMPDLAGQPFAEAKATMISLNLTIGPLTNLSVDPLTGQPVDVPEANRIIIKQSIQAGTEVMVQTVVAFSYGTQLDYDQYLNPTPTPTEAPTPTLPPTETTAPSETQPEPTPGETTTEATKNDNHP